MASQQFVEVAISFGGDHFFDLQRHHFFVTGAVSFVEHAERPGKMTFHTGIIKHANEDLRFVEIALIMHPQIICAGIFSQLNDHRPEAVQFDAFVALCAKDQGLALLQEEGIIGFGRLLSEHFKNAIIEDIAVLIDLQEGRTLVLMAADKRFLQVLGIAVHCPGNKGGIRSHGQGQWVEWMVDTAEGGGLGYFILFRSGGILPFCKAIDLVIEQHHVHIEVAAEQVNGMVTADAQAVAVTGHDPNAEVGPGCLQSAGNGCCTAVDGVHAVRIHIIWEAAAAADSGDDHNIFFGDPQSGHDLLYLRQDGIVAAARAPAYFLVTREILCRQRRGCSYTHIQIQNG